MVKETRAGGVEVKEPKYWYKWTKTEKKLKLQIADGPVDGFHVDPVNMDRGDGLGELDFSYIGTVDKVPPKRSKYGIIRDGRGRDMQFKYHMVTIEDLVPEAVFVTHVGLSHREKDTVIVQNKGMRNGQNQPG